MITYCIRDEWALIYLSLCFCVTTWTREHQSEPCHKIGCVEIFKCHLGEIEAEALRWPSLVI
jgi:hypothetical protein